MTKEGAINNLKKVVAYYRLDNPAFSFTQALMFCKAADCSLEEIIDAITRKDRQNEPMWADVSN